jgi:hypothetical protein
MRYAISISVLALALVAAPFIHAAPSIVGAFGTQEFTVPANQSLNVFSPVSSAVNPCRVYTSTGTVVRFAEHASSPVSGNEVVFTFTVSTRVRISAGAFPAYYNVGALAVANPVLVPTPRLAKTQFSVATYNTTASFVSNDLMKGLITSTQATGGTIELTLPTGALLDAASGLKVNQAFEWTWINDSAAAADSVTLVAASGHTIVGAPIVISKHVTTGGAITSMGNNSATFITRKTAADTFVTYRKN